MQISENTFLRRFVSINDLQPHTHEIHDETLASTNPVKNVNH